MNVGRVSLTSHLTGVNELLVAVHMSRASPANQADSIPSRPMVD